MVTKSEVTLVPPEPSGSLICLCGSLPALLQPVLHRSLLQIHSQTDAESVLRLFYHCIPITLNSARNIKRGSTNK